MMRNDSSRMKAIQAIGPAVLDNDNTPTALDISNFQGCTVLLSIGAGGITFTDTDKVEFKLTHSDDNSTYTAVADEDVPGVTVGTGGIIHSLVAAHAAATIHEIPYVGDKKYLKLLADFGGTHAAGTPISAVVLGTRPIVGPA